MLVHVTTDNHIDGHEELVRGIETTLAGPLARFGTQITRVEVHLADENSHKGGGQDKRCTLEARLAGLTAVAASAQGANLHQAIDAALDKLIAQLDHKLGRLGERKGRSSFAGEAGD